MSAAGDASAGAANASNNVAVVQATVSVSGNISVGDGSPNNNNSNNNTNGNTNGNSNNNGSTAGSSKGQLPLTPRFTAEEKDVLYTLFHLHEEVIDIKHRKKQRNKYSVRDTWDKIVRDFNSHPHVSAMRNIKQIQKFWLNSR